MSNFDDFIQKLQTELPDLITPGMLVELGLASHVRLYRIRQRREIPFLKLSCARIIYMKKDVIDWLKRCYNAPKGDYIEEIVDNEFRKQVAGH